MQNLPSASAPNTVSEPGLENLNGANELLSPATDQHDESLMSHETVRRESRDSDGTKSAGEDSSVESFDSYKDVDLLQNTLTNITDTLDRLYRLSIKIRNPRNRIGASRARSFKNLDEETNIDSIEASLPFEKAHIQEVFAFLQGRSPSKFESDYLVNRLASANIQRRQQFGHWRRHRTKLEQASRARPHLPTETMMDLPQPKEHAELTTAYSKPATAADLYPVLASIDTSVDDVKSVTTDRTVLIDDGKDENNWIQIPPLPLRYRLSKEFECPYCFVICDRRMSTDSKWKNHVLRDLRPYVCTYPSCQMHNQQFDAFHDWAAHEIQVHEMGSASPSQRSKTLQHNSDRSIFEESEAHSVRKQCPICLQMVQKEDLLRNHIAFHLHRIALFALPRLTAVNDDEDYKDAWSGRVNASFDAEDRSEGSRYPSYERSNGSKPFSERDRGDTPPPSRSSNPQASAELRLSSLQELHTSSSGEALERLHKVKSFLTGLESEPPPPVDASEFEELAPEKLSLVEIDTRRPSRRKLSEPRPTTVEGVIASAARLVEDFNAGIERYARDTADLPDFIDNDGRRYSSTEFLKMMRSGLRTFDGDSLSGLRYLNIDILRQIFDDIELEIADRFAESILKLVDNCETFEEWTNHFVSITGSANSLERLLDKTYDGLKLHSRRASLSDTLSTSSAWPRLCTGAIELINGRDHGEVADVNSIEAGPRGTISDRSRNNLQTVCGHYKWWYCTDCQYRCEFHVCDRNDRSLSDSNLILPSTKIPDLYFRETLWAKFHLDTAETRSTYHDGPEVLGCVICAAEGKALRLNIFRRRGYLLRHIQNHHFDSLPSEMIRARLGIATVKPGEIPETSTFDLFFEREQENELSTGRKSFEDLDNTTEDLSSLKSSPPLQNSQPEPKDRDSTAPLLLDVAAGPSTDRQQTEGNTTFRDWLALSFF
ncbi:MAG: hypothetical protein Q9160_009315 [Pyrenula sp. 1 TL-2023]